MDSDQGHETIHLESPSVTSKWNCFGYKFPREEVVYFSQIIIIYVVILFCLINLTLSIGESNLWVALLGSCLGYLLPQPSMEDGPLLHHTPK